MEDCYKPLDGGALGCTEPEIVVLRGQTIKEVKDLLEKNEKLQQENLEELNTLAGVKKKFPEFFDEEKPKDVKLCFDEDFIDCYTQPVLPRDCSQLNKDLPEFVLWRHLSGIAQEDEVAMEWGPAQDLMDLLIIKLKRHFNNTINFSWSAADEGWGHVLKIEDKPTKITASSLAKVLDGLTQIVNIHQAQAIVIQLVLKKLKEIFV